jgi:hypothetical protein
MTDISLLPEEMRGREQEQKEEKRAQTVRAGGLNMHVPEAAPDEEIEIIEVDEGDLAVILSDEPFMTRMTYKLSLAFDKFKDKYLKKKEAAPPPKLPPQFFRPPRPGLVSKAKPAAPGAKPSAPGMRPAAAYGAKARIVPQEYVPRRVRVIRRVKKPVRVSLISAEDLALLAVNVRKRQWTFAVTLIVFASIIVAGHLLISQRLLDARRQFEEVQRQRDETLADTEERKERWSAYEDLEDRLTVLDGVLDGHVVISRLFDFLELRTLPSVSYRTATWSSEGDLVLDVVTDSYESAARQLVAFEETETVLGIEATSFNSQTSAGGGLGESSEGTPSEVGFQIVLELDMASLRGPLLADDTGEEGMSATSTETIPT